MSYLSNAYHSALNSFQGVVSDLEDRLKVGKMSDLPGRLFRALDPSDFEFMLGLTGFYSHTLGGCRSEYNTMLADGNMSAFIQVRAIVGPIVAAGLLIHASKALVNRYILHHKIFMAPDDVKAGDQVALVLQTKKDSFNAFQNHFRMVNNFCKLSEEYKIVFQQPSSVEDLKECIEKIVEKGASPKVVWVRGHGNSFAIELSQGEYLDNYTLDSSDFLQALNQIAPDGTIVLESCSTGAKWGIAEKMARLVQGRKVFAPEVNLNMCGTSLESVSPLKVRFYSAPLLLDRFEITRVFQEVVGV